MPVRGRRGLGSQAPYVRPGDDRRGRAGGRAGARHRPAGDRGARVRARLDPGGTRRAGAARRARPELPHRRGAGSGVTPPGCAGPTRWCSPAATASCRSTAARCGASCAGAAGWPASTRPAGCSTTGPAGSRCSVGASTATGRRGRSRPCGSPARGIARCAACPRGSHWPRSSMCTSPGSTGARRCWRAGAAPDVRSCGCARQVAGACTTTRSATSPRPGRTRASRARALGPALGAG